MGCVDERALLDHEVQAVVNGVDQQHVVVLQRRDRLALALADLQAYRLPGVGAELAVDSPDGLPDLSQVAAVDGNVLARRLKESPELHLAAQLGMVAQQLVVSDEASNNVLRRVRPIDTRNQLRRAP